MIWRLMFKNFLINRVSSKCDLKWDEKKTNIHKSAEIKEIHKYNGENTREMNKKEMKIIYTVYGLKARI